MTRSNDRHARPFGFAPFLAIALILLGPGCSTTPPTKAKPVVAAAEPPPKKPPPAADANRDCARLRELVSAEPILPGTPKLDQARIRILARAKAEPVIFVRPPLADPEAPQTARRLRASLARAPYPGEVLKLLLNSFRLRPDLGRDVILREGYLYAEAPEYAFALVDQLQLSHLFDAKTIWIQRGDRTYHAERLANGNYRYLDGPEKDKAARLFLFDRVGSEAPTPAIHIDLRSLRNELHFDSVKIERATPNHLLATFQYGPLRIPSVVRYRNGRAQLECEIVDEPAIHDLALLRDVAERRLKVASALRREMQNEIEEALPFDEPHREWGQQDGMLRQKWVSAYRMGETSFTMNGDEYPVFDAKGRPVVPQVCVDFLTDTLERASGKWWQPQGQPAGTTPGLIDFTRGHEGTLRQVPAFVELAKRNPEWFDVYETPERERIKFRRKDEFYGYLAAHPERFQAGDIVVIRGYTPFERSWEPKVMHYHSFFIYENDPVTGFPMALVGNPGHPTIRVWETEARRTPKRSIWYRLRPRFHWLETHLKLDPIPSEPAPLSVGPL
ncbi:MAG: hypothetical protein SFV15_22975 [Polyangiaceae bacterium]|nr:hypothetical protein [Polyangiaceae bacterium]